MAEQLLHADIRFAGSIGFNKSYTEFPANARPNTIIVKTGVPYIYTDLGAGFHSWFPMAVKQSSYIHSQGVAANTWTINHNLDSTNYGLFIYDENHTLVSATHEPLTANTVSVNFSSATMGSAVLFAVESFASSSITSTELVIGTLTITDDGQGNLGANGNALAYKQFVLDGLALKADSSALALKADAVTTYTMAQVDALIVSATNGGAY
jgi:hypothetical protein